MLNRLIRCYQQLPVYLACRASPWMKVWGAPYLYFRCVPQQQDAPVIVLTMGKVASITLWQSLLDAGVFFQIQLHNLRRSPPRYPYAERNITSALDFMRKAYFPWLLRRPRVRIVTTVREPISRLISLYLYSYHMRIGVEIEDTSLQALLDDFPRVFENDYTHPAVPGCFLSEEIKAGFGINVYDHDFSQSRGAAIIEQGRFSLLIMKLEIEDDHKSAALSAWMGRKVEINRKNTASDAGYDHFYAEFKRRVRIPYRYAEAIYQSAYMKKFYTPEEREGFWQRWEPQLDRSIILPDWVEEQLQAYHPPID